MSNRHTVRTHHWVNGKLIIRVEIFASLNEALEYLKILEFYSAKIYNELGILIRELSGKTINSYA